MTIQEAYPLFLAHGRAERHYAQQTLGKVRDCFNAWILPCLGEKALETLSRADVIEFRGEMLDAKLGVNRQYQILMMLKLLLRFARHVLKIECLDRSGPRSLPQACAARAGQCVTLTNADSDVYRERARRTHTAATGSTAGSSDQEPLPGGVGGRVFGIARAKRVLGSFERPDDLRQIRLECSYYGEIAERFGLGVEAGGLQPRNRVRAAFGNGQRRRREAQRAT